MSVKELRIPKMNVFRVAPDDTELSLGMEPSHSFVENEWTENSFLTGATKWIYICSGSGYLKIGYTTVQIEKGDFVRIDPGVEHSMISKKGEQLVVLSLVDSRIAA